jgi:HK97 family phage portal protein
MNPLSQFINDRFIRPQVDAQVDERLSRSTNAFAYGLSPVKETTITEAIGQPHDANYHLLYAVYRLHPDVAACVRLWAGGVTGNGWDLALMDDADPNRNQRKAIDEIKTWLKNPNPSKRFYRLLYELTEHLAITGDSYVQKVKAGGTVRELWSIHPATMRVVMSEHGEVIGYVQRANGRDVANFKPDEISHLALPSVINDAYGHSPLETAMEAVGLSLQAMRSNRAMFENGLSPSAVALLSKELKFEQQKAAAEMIKQGHTGADKRHKLLTFAGVDDIKPWAQTNHDMEFHVLSELTTEQIANAFGVPKLFLNKKDAADYATSAAQERRFYNTTIKPLQDQIAEIMTEEIIHEINPDLKFVFGEPDFNDPDKLRTDALSLYGKNDKVIDANELRTKYFGLEAKDPDELEADPVEAPKTDTGAQQQETDEATQAPDKQTTGAKKHVTKALTSDEQDALAQQREAEQEALAQGADPAIVSFFTDQQQRYLDQLNNGPIDAEQFLIDTAADALLFAALLPAINASLNAGATAAQLQIEITLAFDQINPIVADYLKTQALTHVQGINQTTRDALRVEMQAGTKAGESIEQLTERIKAVFADASTNRANVIARTETAQAYSYANKQAAIATGLDLRREWITALDDRVCVICGPLHGVTVGLHENYPGGLEPGYAHIQDRCTEVFEVAA